MRTLIKFCGLVRPEDVDHAVALGVNAVGFVFYAPSPRAIDAVQAGALRRRLPSFVAAVGLFVNETNERIRAISREVGLDAIQFHGDETPEQCATLDQPWWRAVRMRGPDDLLESSTRFKAAECLLLDAYSEGYGGSGRSFDWSWIGSGGVASGGRSSSGGGTAGGQRIVLSGGLDARTVESALAAARPFGVDVSSGIQGATPRQKDHARMEQFVAAVLRADARALDR